MKNKGAETSIEHRVRVGFRSRIARVRVDCRSLIVAEETLAEALGMSAQPCKLIHIYWEAAEGWVCTFTSKIEMRDGGIAEWGILDDHRKHVLSSDTCLSWLSLSRVLESKTSNVKVNSKLCGTHTCRTGDEPERIKCFLVTLHGLDTRWVNESRDINCPIRWTDARVVT